MSLSPVNAALSSDEGRRGLRSWVIVAVVAGMLVASLIAAMFSARTAFAGTCATSNGHCYGVVDFSNSFIGAITQEETVSLFSVNDGVNHISDEMWLIDTSHSCSGSNSSWVEAGEATEVGHTGNWYFWADCRPGSSFFSHFQYQPPSGDVDHFQQYQISKNSSPANSYLVSMQNAASGIVQWNATSTSNTITPNNIEVGLETTNNSYSVTHAESDLFQFNRWENPSGGWNYQLTSGAATSSNPPNWTWITVPEIGGSGGEGETSCC